MPRLTIKALQEQLAHKNNLVDWQVKEIGRLDQEISFLKKYSSISHLNTMAVALERISDACAHTIADLKKRS